MRRGGRRGLIVAALLLVVAAACGSSSKNKDNPTVGSAAAASPTSGAPVVTGSITVLAASSLTDSFNEIGKRFQAAHPGVNVTFSYDASSTLVQQVNAGAPADVLATADDPTMQQAVTAGTVTAPVEFAHNRLAIIVPKGNPKAIHGLADLAKPGVVVVLCAAEVPCGKYGAQALTNAGVNVTPKSLEPNVKGVVSKVTLGEADAGIVYVTDVKAAAANADGVDIPASQNVLANYPIATVKASHNASAATAFVAFVQSPDGRSVLSTAGFDAGP